MLQRVREAAQIVRGIQWSLYHDSLVARARRNKTHYRRYSKQQLFLMSISDQNNGTFLEFLVHAVGVLFTRAHYKSPTVCAWRYAKGHVDVTTCSRGGDVDMWTNAKYPPLFRDTEYRLYWGIFDHPVHKWKKISLAFTGYPYLGMFGICTIVGSYPHLLKSRVWMVKQHTCTVVYVLDKTYCGLRVRWCVSAICVILDHLRGMHTLHWSNSGRYRQPYW